MSCPENFYVHFEESIPSRCFGKLENMLKSEQLCDVIITCEDASISAHKVVLAATIPFFHNLFTRGFAEKADGKIVVEGIEPGALESLIHFAYTCKLKIAKENVESLIKASSLLQLNSVKHACCEFLLQHIDRGNAVHLRDLSESLNCVDLLEACDRCICENFEDIFKSDQFINISFSAFVEALGRDNLAVPSEQHVFEAILKWVKGSEDARKALLPELLKLIRMPFVTPEYLIKHVATEELIKTSFACRDIVEEAKNYHLIPRPNSVFCFSMKPRKYRNLEEHGLFFFCYKEHLGLSVNYYNSDTGVWLKLVTVSPKENQKFHRFAHYLAAKDNSVYAVGNSYSEVLNVKNLEWTVRKSLHKMPSCCGIVFAENKMYFFNGMFPSKMRCFDLEQNLWLREICMKMSRHSVGTAVLEECIYVTGGVLQEWHEISNVTNAVEKYSCRTQQWTELSPMLNMRYGHGCATLNDKIYACGGCDLEKFNTGEVFDPKTNQWSYIASMKLPRVSFSLVAYNRKLYAFDSPLRAGQSFSHDVDVYDPNNNEWTPGPSICCQHESEIAVTGVPATVSAVAISAKYK